jgi:hypothetical protein
MPQRNIARQVSSRRNTFSVTLRTAVRGFAPALALGAAGLTVACADGSHGPTAPQASAVAGAAQNTSSTSTSTSSSTSTSTSGTTVGVLRWTTPATQATVSAVIGSAGGSFAHPSGLRLTVPKGAVSSNVTFSITRRPGGVVAYDFQPHGIRFAQPLTVQHPTAGTNFFQLSNPGAVEGAYFADASGINASTGTAVVNEFRPTSVSADRGAIAFTVSHFSGYIITTGRTR